MKIQYSTPEIDMIEGAIKMDLMLNPSAGNIENPGNGGEDWDW